MPIFDDTPFGKHTLTL